MYLYPFSKYFPRPARHQDRLLGQVIISVLLECRVLIYPAPCSSEYRKPKRLEFLFMGLIIAWRLYHQKVYRNWFCAAEEEPLVECVARDAGVAKCAFSHLCTPEQRRPRGTLGVSGDIPACHSLWGGASGVFWVEAGAAASTPPAPWAAPQHRVLLTPGTAVPLWEILPWWPPGEMDFKEMSFERIRRLFCSDLHGHLFPRAALGQRSDCTARLVSWFLSGALCPRSPCTAPMLWVMRPAYSGTPRASGTS